MLDKPEPAVLCQSAGGICRLTLNRPASRNALSLDMLDQLHCQIDAAARDATVRVIIITARGPAFCAGHDLKEITGQRATGDHGAAWFTRLMDRCAQTMLSIVNCPKPVIAQVHAIASAAGCQLVASCDLAYAARSAKFCTPGVNIGLFCSTPMVALSRNVAAKHAMEMLLTGDPVSAEHAARIGLVNAVADDAALTGHVTAIADKIAARPAHTLKLGKAAFYRQAAMPLAAAYAHTSKVMVENLLHDDACEGISAFIEKRPAHWKD